MGAFNSGETLRIITLLYNSMLRSKSLQSYISHAKISGNQFLCWSSAIVSSEKLEKIGRILRFHIGIKYQTRYLYLYPPHFEKPLSLSLSLSTPQRYNRIYSTIEEYATQNPLPYFPCTTRGRARRFNPGLESIVWHALIRQGWKRDISLSL